MRGIFALEKRGAWAALLVLAWGAGPLRAGGGEDRTGQVITLEQAYDIALSTDQSIAIAEREIRKSNLLTWSALTRVAPRLTGGAGYNYTQRRAPGTVIVSEPSLTSAGESRVTSIVTATEASNADLSLVQPLFDFGVFPAYRLGKLAAAASRLQHQYQIRQVLYGVTSAYYQVLIQKGVVNADEKTVDAAEHQLEVAKKRFNVGEVTRTDALTAEVTLESSRSTLIAARNTLLLNRDTLGNLLNLGGDTGFQVVVPDNYPTAIPSFEKLLAIAMRNREDLRAAELAIGEDTERKNEVLAEYAPSIVGQVDGSVDNAKGLYGPQTQVWDAAVTVSLPFFTGGQREIDLKTAKYQIDETRLNRDKVAKTVEGDVRQAWLSAHSLQDGLRALKLAVDAARQAAEDIEHEYEAGTETSVDVLVSINSLNQAENAYVTQLYNLQVALRDLEEVAGVFQQGRVERARIR